MIGPASSWARLLLAAASLCVADAAFGWIYPEHRDVTVLAVQGLDEARREQSHVARETNQIHAPFA